MEAGYEPYQYKWNWVGISARKRNTSRLWVWEFKPKDYVQAILDRATKYRALTYEQTDKLAYKASQKYSGHAYRTYRAVCPVEMNGSFMYRGQWDLTESRRKLEEQTQKARLERLEYENSEALIECKIEQRPYCEWPKIYDGDKSLWEKTLFELIDDEEDFLKSELPDGVCRAGLENEDGKKVATRVYYCECCKRLGGKKKVRFYSGFKKGNHKNSGMFCVACWNKLRPVWKAENEWKEIQSLANKLEREAKNYGKERKH